MIDELTGGIGRILAAAGVVGFTFTVGVIERVGSIAADSPEGIAASTIGTGGAIALTLWLLKYFHTRADQAEAEHDKAELKLRAELDTAKTRVVELEIRVAQLEGERTHLRSQLRIQQREDNL